MIRPQDVSQVTVIHWSITPTHCDSGSCSFFGGLRAETGVGWREAPVTVAWRGISTADLSLTQKVWNRKMQT